jgi:germination protein M
MIKKFSVKKILIASLLLLVALILYSYPEELDDNVIEKKYDSINIYLIDSNNYVAMTSILSKENDFDYKLRTIIDSLTVGSSNVPKGFSSVIPRDTKLIDYSLDGNLLKINFSKQLLDVSVDDEDRMIQSIVYSLTSLDNVDKVMIFIEGEILNKLPNSHKRLDTYLDRSYGINRVIDIDKLSGSSCVTVYYLGSNNSYVPISYITNDDTDKIEIIVNSLKSNRLNSSNLSSHLDYQVELMNYERVDDEFFLNFSDTLLSSVYEGKLKEEVKYALSYSILDTFNVENVVFLINSNKIDELRLAK